MEAGRESKLEPDWNVLNGSAISCIDAEALIPKKNLEKGETSSSESDDP